MNWFDLLSPPEGYASNTHHIYGVVVGVVTDNQDPDKLGRVKISFPWLSSEDEGYWARLASPMAGKGRGLYFLPEVEDEVLVVFEQGDLRFPYIIGALWNGKDTPPIQNDDGKNNIRLIRSRSGHVVRLDDTQGSEKIEILDKSTKNSITLDTAANTITITADKDITLSAPKGAIKLEAQSLDLSASQDLKVAAKTQTDINGGTTMNLKGNTINLN